MLAAVDLHIGKAAVKIKDTLHRAANRERLVAQMQNRFFLLIGIQHLRALVAYLQAAGVRRLPAALREKAGAV